MNEATRRLGIRHPLIQGPFGGGLSTVKLVATVSNAGGMGSFGAHVTPPEQMETLTRETRAQTNQPFALNLWISDHDPGGLELTQAEFDRVYAAFEPYFKELGVDKPERPQRYHQSYEKQVEALLEARPPCFSFVFGIPSPTILAECKRRGIATIGTATSIAEAQALDEAGVDLIVATGMDAGGHRVSFLARPEDSLIGTFALTQIVAARVKAPVIAAGGIVDGRGVKAALALGAQAAQLGTAFLACEESGTTPEHRAVLFSDQAQHTVLTRAFSGRLARGVRNRWTDEIAPKLGRIAPFPVQNWFMARLRPAAVKAGRTDLVSLWAGQAAPNLRHRHAGALMDSLIAELG
jgi:nitronate monooxygenase